jgi:hypothetical protein
MGTLGALQNIRGAVEGPSLTGLKTAQEVATQVRVSPGRLEELANAMLVPHFRIDGGEPLFSPSSLKRYVQRHLTFICEGAPLPLYLRPVVLTPVRKEVPMALAAIQEQLCESPSVEIPPCVYFLIASGSVVYVGQTRSLAARLVQHMHSGKHWDRVLFVPLPEAELVRVEAYWIAALQPPLNQTVTSHRGLEDCRDRQSPSINQPLKGRKKE